MSHLTLQKSSYPYSHHTNGSRRRMTVDAPSSPSSASRKLGDIESFFCWANARHGAFTFVSVLQCEGMLDLQRFSEAVSQIHHGWPMLSAMIVRTPSGAITLERTEGSEPDLRVVQRRSDADWKATAECLVNEPFPCRIVEDGSEVWSGLWSVTVLEGCGRQEILIRIHHSLCDGLNIGYLFHTLLSVYAAPEQSADFLGTPGLGRAVERYLPPAARTLATLSFFREEARNLFRTPRLARQLGVAPTNNPQRTSTCSTVLSKAETAALLQRSKAEGTTLHAAICASVLLVLLDRSPELRQVALQTNIDLRRRYPLHIAPTQLGVYVYWVLTWHCRQDGSFWDLARSYRDGMTRAIKSRGLPPWGFFPMARAFLGRQVVRSPLISTSEANVSNLGVLPIQQEYGRLRTTQFFAATSQNVLGSQICWMAGTLHGRLGLTCSTRSPLESEGNGEILISEVRRHIAQSSKTSMSV